MDAGSSDRTPAGGDGGKHAAPGTAGPKTAASGMDASVRRKEKAGGRTTEIGSHENDDDDDDDVDELAEALEKKAAVGSEPWRQSGEEGGELEFVESAPDAERRALETAGGAAGPESARPGAHDYEDDEEIEFVKSAPDTGQAPGEDVEDWEHVLDGDDDFPEKRPSAPPAKPHRRHRRRQSSGDEERKQ